MFKGCLCEKILYFYEVDKCWLSINCLNSIHNKVEIEGLYIVNIESVVSQQLCSLYSLINQPQLAFLVNVS